MTNEERAEKLVVDITGDKRQASSLASVGYVLSFADEIRRECAEKREEIYQAGFRKGKWFAMNTGPLKPVPDQPSMEDAIAAIMGKEAGV